MGIKDFEIGQLRQLAKLEKNIAAPLGSGYEDNYSEVLTTRGNLKKKNGSRALGFGQITLESEYLLIVRAENAINTLLADNPMAGLRWVVDNRFFTITSYEKREQKGFFYIFQLNESQL